MSFKSAKIKKTKMPTAQSKKVKQLWKLFLGGLEAHLASKS
jgi:hypothetical protein